MARWSCSEADPTKGGWGHSPPPRHFDYAEGASRNHEGGSGGMSPRKTIGDTYLPVGGWGKGPQPATGVEGGAGGMSPRIRLRG